MVEFMHIHTGTLEILCVYIIIFLVPGIVYESNTGNGSKFTNGAYLSISTLPQYFQKIKTFRGNSLRRLVDNC